MKNVHVQGLLILSSLFLCTSHQALCNGSKEREQREYCERRLGDLKCKFNNLQSEFNGLEHKFNALQDQHEKALHRNQLLEQDLAACAEEIMVVKKRSSETQQAFEQEQGINLQKEQRIKEFENAAALLIQEKTTLHQQNAQLQLQNQQQDQRIKELEGTVIQLTQEISRLGQQHAHDMEERMKIEQEQNTLQNNIQKEAQQPIHSKEAIMPEKHHETLPLPPTTGN